MQYIKNVKMYEWFHNQNWMAMPHSTHKHKNPIKYSTRITAPQIVQCFDRNAAHIKLQIRIFGVSTVSEWSVSFLFMRASGTCDSVQKLYFNISLLSPPTQAVRHFQRARTVNTCGVRYHLRNTHSLQTHIYTYIHRCLKRHIRMCAICMPKLSNLFPTTPFVLEYKLLGDDDGCIMLYSSAFA